MKMISEKIYGTFSANERVNLTIAALARGDDEEIKLLSASCPKRIFKINEPEYAEQMDKMQHLCQS